MCVLVAVQEKERENLHGSSCCMPCREDPFPDVNLLFFEKFKIFIFFLLSEIIGCPIKFYITISTSA